MMGIELLATGETQPSSIPFQLEQDILNFSEGLRVVGVVPDEKLALFADNSCRWLVADQGIMAIGAINVVRGTRSSEEELLQIYNHSESIALILDNPDFINRLAESFIPTARIRFIILIWGEKSDLSTKALKDMHVYDYKEIIELERENRHALLDSCEEGQRIICEPINPGDIATLMYTSGTSGNPKGVMLTHQNLLHQEDLKQFQPHYLISVPLVYETLYSSIQKQISSSSTAQKFIALLLIKISLLYMEAKRVYEGRVLIDKQNQQSSIAALVEWLWARMVAAILWPLHNLGKKLIYRKIHSSIGISKAGISGGGSLPMYIDKFFEAIGVKLQNGYGLTETSPVVAARRPACNVLGTIGHPLNFTEVKIVDIESGKCLPDGSKGIVKVRGPQVMKGYYKNPSATNDALDGEGWFNTGDIGWVAPKNSVGRSRECGGMIVLEGRAKDTIVLSTGENVEPSELEEAAMRSSLIQQIMVVGQDQRRLGALIVPNKDELLSVAKNLSIVDANSTELSKDQMMSLLYNEVRTWTSGCTFQIGPILLVEEPFTIDNGLMTPTMKIRRDRVTAQYREQIANLYK